MLTYEQTLIITLGNAQDEIEDIHFQHKEDLYYREAY